LRSSAGILLALLGSDPWIQRTNEESLREYSGFLST
jgi:hypothetical protein